MTVLGGNEYVQHLSYLFIRPICFAVAAQIMKRSLGSHLPVSILSVPDDGYSSNVPDEVYSRNASYALTLISTFLFNLSTFY